MLAGTMIAASLLESDTLEPPLNAAPLKFAVQTVDPGAFMLDGAHEIELNGGGTGCTIVTEPDVPDEGIVIPFGSAVTTLAI